MKITTTLQLLRTKNMYAPRYEHLLKSLGAGWPDKRPINLLQILEYSGAEDALRALRAAQEPEADRIARIIACECAETVLHIFELKFPGDTRPRDAIRMSRRFVIGKVTQAELRTARIAAGDAACAWPAPYAAYNAAYAAYYAAAANATDGAAFAGWRSVIAAAKASRDIGQKEARAAAWDQIGAVIRRHLS